MKIAVGNTTPPFIIFKGLESKMLCGERKLRT